MRTYKDAKTMAKSLRESRTANNFLLSYSECLEIVARVAGFADWNTLSAKLDGGRPEARLTSSHTRWNLPGATNRRD